MASIIKRCDCGDWVECPHPWIVRYRAQGGRASRQREESLGDDRKGAENFLLKVVPSSWDRARTVLDNAHRVGRQQPQPPETPS